MTGRKHVFKQTGILLAALLAFGACAAPEDPGPDKLDEVTETLAELPESAEKPGTEQSNEETENMEMAQPEMLFADVKPAKSYKDIMSHNPCITQKFSADPGVMVYGDRVYVYATNDGTAAENKPAKNEYGNIRTINVMSSADLVNWEDHGSIPVAGKDGIASWAANSWAPCACHKEIGGKEKFFLYFANNGSGIGVLTADSPTGPWTDPIGEPLIPWSTPGIQGVVWLFDPAVLVDDDGSGYLYFGGGVPEGENENPKTFRVIKLSDDMVHTEGEAVMIDAPWTFEDSCINRIGDTYYYSYCTNWAGGPLGNARIAYMTSENPMGPFTYQDTCFNNPGEFFQTTGNNHHTIISFRDEQYIFYHAEFLNQKMYGEMLGYRTTHVDKLPMTDGAFGNARGTTAGVAQLQAVDAFAVNRGSCFAWQGGVNISGSGETVAELETGDWIGISGVDFGDGAKRLKVVASSNEGGVLRVTKGTVGGQVLGYLEIPAGAGAQEIAIDVEDAAGEQNLFFLASGDAALSTWQFEK